MNIYHGDTIYLSVNHERRLSLWDSQLAACQSKEHAEVVITLILTPEQLEIIKLAQTVAQRKVNRR